MFKMMKLKRKLVIENLPKIKKKLNTKQNKNII